MFFWKRRPVEPFKPYIRAEMNGLGNITMKYWPEPNIGFYIPCPREIVNHIQAEEYAKKYLEDLEKAKIKVWRIDVSI